MTRAVARDPIYRQRRFPAEIIELCVRWYITYRLSYRDLVAMMAERGVTVSHTTILRWVLRYVPEFEKRWARYARPVSPSWRMDETAVSVRGGKHYLYRAVDRQGKSIEHLLFADRTRDAAQAFFRKAVTTHAGEWPRTVNLDGNAASHLALRMLGEKDPTWQRVVVRDHRYLNYVIEQDHRAIKSRCVSMLGFKSFGTARPAGKRGSFAEFPAGFAAYPPATTGAVSTWPHVFSTASSSPIDSQVAALRVGRAAANLSDSSARRQSRQAEPRGSH